MKGFKKGYISNALDETDMLWKCSEEDGDFRSVRKMQALTVKMEKVTLIGKGRRNLPRFVY